MEYLNKVVVVTGAGKGIGKYIATEYASKGAKVIIAERDAEAGQATEKEIQKSGEAVFIRTDVKDEKDIINLMGYAETVFGGIDVLINNAGVSRWKSPYELTVAEWDDIININLRGMFLCAKEAAKVMRKRGGGAIVNIASTRAFMSEPNSEAYAASKGGIIAMTHALAISLAQDMIRVNVISPGWIETGDYSLLKKIDHTQHPSMRVGKPQDIAQACLFLTRPDSDFINGANIVIDGGMTKKMLYVE